MEQIASGLLNFRFSDVFGDRSLVRSCSYSTEGGTALLDFRRLPQSICLRCQFNGAECLQNSIERNRKRRALRSLQSLNSTEDGSCAANGDVLGGSCIDHRRALRLDSAHNTCATESLDSKVGVYSCERGRLDRQDTACPGRTKAVTPSDNYWRTNYRTVLTAEDSFRDLLSSFERPEPVVASQERIVLPHKPSNGSKQLCVAVDVDEVLGSFLASLNLFIKETYSLHHDLSEYYIYDFKKIWNCSQGEANHRVHAFFDSDHFKNGISPIPGARQALLGLAAYCQLVVVTSRQHVIRERTLQWIDQYFAGIFKEVHFGNHFALEGPSKAKSEICRSLGAHVLIDDNPGYALECAKSGIEVLLFDLHGNYAWSKTPCGPRHPLITRVKDWQEVEQALLARTCAKAFEK